MRWTVDGADKESGFDRSITIEAGSKAEAEMAASSTGLLVAEVRPLRNGEPKPEVVEYLGANDVTSPIPNYDALRFGASILTAFAFVYYVIAAFCMVTAIIAGMTETTPIAGATAFVIALWAVGLLMIGGLFHAAGSACTALRDIARNSFRR